MNRRQFFLAWLYPTSSNSVEVEVMEVFTASDGPSALLVHHVSESARNAFGEWLRSHDGVRIVCRLRDGTKADGRIFRVRMCFGRGLIVTPAPLDLHAKDVVTIL